MKLLLKLGLVLLIGFLLLSAAGYFLLPPAAKKAIESGTQGALGTPTTLDQIKAGFGFGSTSMGVAGFSADQPKGFEGPAFLEIGAIGVSVDTFSVLSSTVKVPEVRLSGLQLRLVQNGTESNFLQVYQHVQQFLDGQGTAPKEEDSEGSGKSVDIGLLKVSGVAASFDLTGIPGINKSYSFELPAFEVDLSQETNQARIQSIEQATALMTSKVIEQAVGYAKAKVGPQYADLIGGDIAGLKERAKEELMKRLELGGADVEAWKGAAMEKLRDELGADVGEAVENALGKDGVKAVEDALGEGAKKAVDGVLDSVKGKNTEESLKESAGDAVKKGADELKKGVGGLLGGDKKKD